jgi:hypothetical protein
MAAAFGVRRLGAAFRSDNAKRGEPATLHFRDDAQITELLDIIATFRHLVCLLQTKSGAKPPHSKDSVNLCTARILHMVDAIEV